MSEGSASAPPTTVPPPAPAPRPRRCLVTLLGLFAMGLSFLGFAAILIWQRISTGSFERGDGFLLGPLLGEKMLLSFVSGLVLLLAGSIVDSIRYGRWKKSQA